jgi:hypothetical protein
MHGSGVKVELDLAKQLFETHKVAFPNAQPSVNGFLIFAKSVDVQFASSAAKEPGILFWTHPPLDEEKKIDGHQFLIDVIKAKRNILLKHEYATVKFISPEKVALISKTDNNNSPFFFSPMGGAIATGYDIYAIHHKLNKSRERKPREKKTSMKREAPIDDELESLIKELQAKSKEFFILFQFECERENDLARPMRIVGGQSQMVAKYLATLKDTLDQFEDFRQRDDDRIKPTISKVLELFDQTEPDDMKQIPKLCNASDNLVTLLNNSKPFAESVVPTKKKKTSPTQSKKTSANELHSSEEEASADKISKDELKASTIEAIKSMDIGDGENFGRKPLLDALKKKYGFSLKSRRAEIWSAAAEYCA